MPIGKPADLSLGRQAWTTPAGPSGATQGSKPVLTKLQTVMSNFSPAGGPQWMNRMWADRNRNREKIEMAKYMPNAKYKTPGGPRKIQTGAIVRPVIKPIQPVSQPVNPYAQGPIFYKPGDNTTKVIGPLRSASPPGRSAILYPPGQTPPPLKKP